MRTTITASTNGISAIDPDKLLTSHEAGLLLQCNPSTINKWVEQGRIQAFRTPGGHRRVRARDLVTFLTEYKMPVPAALGGASAAVSRSRVLVVDRDKTHTAGLKRRLGPGVDVASVVDEFGLGFALGADRPDLVLIEYLTITQSVDTIRRTKAAGATVVVIGTASKDDDSYRKAGAVACLEKPVSADDLTPYLEGA